MKGKNEQPIVQIDMDKYEAAILDMDGVVTETARAHAAFPSTIDSRDEIIQRLCEGRPAIFLDYDGTLTPIVNDPAQAILPDRTRHLLKKLAEHWAVVIVTGRALDDVKALVGLDNLGYAGSHGLNMVGPENSFHEIPGEKDLKEEVDGLKGGRVERKLFSIAVHFRLTADDIIPELEQRFDRVVSRH